MIEAASRRSTAPAQHPGSGAMPVSTRTGGALLASASMSGAHASDPWSDAARAAVRARGLRQSQPSPTSCGTAVDAVDAHALGLQEVEEARVDGLELRLGDPSARHGRLVGDDHEAQVRSPERAQALGRSGSNATSSGCRTYAPSVWASIVPSRSSRTNRRLTTGAQTASARRARTPSGHRTNGANCPPRRSSASRTAPWRSGRQ